MKRLLARLYALPSLAVHADPLRTRTPAEALGFSRAHVEQLPEAVAYGNAVRL